MCGGGRAGEGWGGRLPTSFPTCMAISLLPKGYSPGEAAWLRLSRLGCVCFTPPPPLLLTSSPPPPSPLSCRPLLVATYNPEEGALREHLLDRIAVTLSADVPQSFDDRVRAIDAAMRFQDRAKDVFAETDELTEALKTSVRKGEGGRGGEGRGWRGCCGLREGKGHVPLRKLGTGTVGGGPSSTGHCHPP